jgi:hypothetical protein
VISDIVALARDLSNLRETLRGARREKRDRLASYFEQIGASLDDAHADLREGGNAVRACAQLHQYVDLIPPTVDETLGAEKAALLRGSLRTALFLRGLPRSSGEDLDDLARAAGTFTGLAVYLRGPD